MAAREVTCPQCGKKRNVDGLVLKAKCDGCGSVWAVTDTRTKSIELQKGKPC